MIKAIGYAAQNASAPLKPLAFDRHQPGANDSQIDILYCGVSQVAFHRRTIAGSLIGGIAETQAVLDFYIEHSVVPDVEMIPIQQINEAHEPMIKGDVKYRFVIDMAPLKA